MLERVACSTTSIGVIGTYCVPEITPPVPSPPPVPQVPSPPTAQPPRSPPAPPAGCADPDKVTITTYMDDRGFCWRVVQIGCPSPFHTPQKEPINC